MRELPLLGVLAAVVVGLALVAVGHWRMGAGVVGVALLAGSGLRLVLRERAAGLLAVRSRPFDTVVLLVLGSAVLGLARAIPAG